MKEYTRAKREELRLYTDEYLLELLRRYGGNMSAIYRDHGIGNTCYYRFGSMKKARELAMGGKP